MSQEQNKTESSKPQAKPKKEISYTYWVDQKNKSRQLPPQQRPQKIQVSPPSLLKKEQSGRSDWNNSGTWQQRKVSINDIEKDFSAALTKYLQIQNDPKIVKKISLEGQIEIIFSRNKKNLMYEISGKIQFQSEKDLFIKIVELNDQGDQQYTVKAQISEQKQWLNKECKGMMKLLDQTIQKYKN